MEDDDFVPLKAQMLQPLQERLNVVETIRRVLERQVALESIVMSNVRHAPFVPSNGHGISTG